MKHFPRSSRIPSELPESINQRLGKYALAASAAGVSLLALANPAEARIVYTHAHQKLPINKNFFLDLNHDGIKDFKFHLNSGPGYSISMGLDGALVNGTVKNSVLSSVISTVRSNWVCAVALPKGAKVGPKSPFRSGGLMGSVFRTFSHSRSICPWRNVPGQAYVGVKFLIKGKVHYGWARFANVLLKRGMATATLTGYAYETIPNKPIITGKTRGPDEVRTDAATAITLPAKPATLGVLATGAPGLSIWRRKEMLGSGEGN